MPAGKYYDHLETRDPEAREAALMAALPRQVAHAKAKAPGFATLLNGIDPAAIDSRAALADLPMLRKADLMVHQRQSPPLGGLATIGLGEVSRLFASPGPVYEPQGRRVDFWRCARALYAAGFRAGELVHNSFSYHLTPGGWILDGAARALGCSVFPAGVGNSEQQVQAISDLRPTAFTGTPDYLRVLLDKAAEMGWDASSIVKALVSGGALFPSLRQDYAERGVSVLQCYATADVGMIAYESLGMNGPNEGMILNEEIIVEIVRPGTGDPLPDGEVGEVVVTMLDPDYPMIRFATGDLSAVLPGASPCGRTGTRIKGWMGRADQTTKIKGMFVHPSQVSAVVKRHPEIAKARLAVTRDGEADHMTLHCEVAGGDAAGAPLELAETIAHSLHDVCKLKGGVVFAEPGSLPNDGKVIDDQRSYE